MPYDNTFDIVKDDFFSWGKQGIRGDTFILESKGYTTGIISSPRGRLSLYYPVYQCVTTTIQPSGSTLGSLIQLISHYIPMIMSRTSDIPFYSHDYVKDL